MIKAIDLTEGAIVVGLEKGIRLPPSICTKIKRGADTTTFRVENRHGSFWFTIPSLSTIDAVSLVNFLRRLD